MLEVAKRFGRPVSEFQRRLDGRIEWVCKHGVGHTVWSEEGSENHCCDGCCSELRFFDHKRGSEGSLFDKSKA